MKRPSTPPWRHGSLAVALFLAASCSPISVEQRDSTVSRHVTRVQDERAPEHDRLEVRGHLEGDIAVVEVAGGLACLVRDSETRVVRRATIRRADPVVVVLEVVGGGVGGVLLLISSLGPGHEPGKDDSSGVAITSKPRAELGLGLIAAGIAAGIIEGAKARDSSEEREATVVSPAHLAPCAASAARGWLVSLVAPDATFKSIADEHGVARILIDDASWARYGGVLDAEVRLDGAPVGRIRLVRGAH